MFKTRIVNLTKALPDNESEGRELLCSMLINKSKTIIEMVE